MWYLGRVVVGVMRPCRPSIIGKSSIEDPKADRRRPGLASSDVGFNWIQLDSRVHVYADLMYVLRQTKVGQIILAGVRVVLGDMRNGGVCALKAAWSCSRHFVYMYSSSLASSAVYILPL